METNVSKKVLFQISRVKKNAAGLSETFLSSYQTNLGAIKKRCEPSIYILALMEDMRSHTHPEQQILIHCHTNQAHASCHSYLSSISCNARTYTSDFQLLCLRLVANKTLPEYLAFPIRYTRSADFVLRLTSEMLRIS